MSSTFRDPITDENGAVLGEGPEMVTVPAGRFLLGSPATDPDRSDAEGPQVEITLARPFAIGATLVTVGQYNLYLAHRRQLPSRYWDEEDMAQVWPYYINGQLKRLTRAQYLSLPEITGPHPLPGPDSPLRRLVARRHQQADHFPVHYMNWFDAKAYAVWLSERTGKRYRLPSEAEWEYAMRAGTTTAYFWGESLPDELRQQIDWCYRASYPDGMQGRKRRGFPPEKFFPPNPWGIYRNYLVREWVEDAWHENHANAPRDGSARIPAFRAPQGSEHTQRVQRGGPRAPTRGHDAGCYRSPNRGFRIVREID